MKTIEEKARAYDEALKWMSDLYPTLEGSMKEDAEHYFPELKDGGDEGVWLTKFIQEEIDYLCIDVRDNDDRIKLKNLRRSLAWLEKQAEHADFRNKIQIGDKVTRNKDGVLVNLSQLKRVANKDENQCEQKQEWSKEDEVGLSDVLWAIEQARTIAKDENDMGNLWCAEHFAKSLKDRLQPQTTWKPSDEQMADLWNMMCESRPEDHQLLQDIYYGLKSLKGDWL